MNAVLTKLKGLTKNRAALGAGGAAVVVLLALQARKRSGGGESTAGGARVSSTPYYSVGGQSGAATGYDSSASDVYNAIQPQLEDLGRQQSALEGLLDKLHKDSAPIPVPVPESTPTDDRRGVIAGFYQTILGRTAARSEINHWDAYSPDLDLIRAGILGSDEARAAR